ncbi:hypothetical protein HBF26_17125 [Luteibacter jiangsuensis]|uniref:Uncharacterized protein n=1 Tax=Luteibacter jiangsuensis TaxID=637577 RepID=A0ABX0Q9R2_9GAMM|nr:hypothetical protein [Luteibacter jiangsuensis]NID06620.1 hypothetical protein [Luteibacter jiangsuensis]
MGTSLNKPNCQTLAERAWELARVANQLIADIESDLNAPGDAAFRAKDAFDALNAAHLALLDAQREQAVRHYSRMAVESCWDAIGGAA